VKTEANLVKKSFTIHDLPVSERPRERLKKLGEEALSTPEVLALVLGRGISGESVMFTCQRLILEFGNLKGISEASLEELSTIRGIGEAKACQIKAAFELGKRLGQAPVNGGKSAIQSPETAVEELKSRLKGKKKEHFWTIFLNTRNLVIKSLEISRGSLDTSIVHPREVFKEAVAASAASVILAHNHPSGNTEPSEDDIKLTKRLVQAGDIFGIQVLDHIIISDTGYFSLKTEGLF
jgi:DNA repair protein RadC